MAENVVDLLNAITAVRGEEYAQGMVDMANLLTTTAKPAPTTTESHPE